MPEIISDDVNGMIISMEEPYQLATLLEKILLDSSLIEKLGFNALKTYEKVLAQRAHMELFEPIDRTKV